MVSAFEAMATPKTHIRVATPDDARFIAAIENDIELKRLVGGVSGKSEEDYRSFLGAPRDLRFLIVESSTTGIPIGVCGLLTGSFSEDCEIRVILMKDYWRQGLGTEIAGALKERAAEVYPGKHLTMKIHPENTGSLKIARALGMTEDGTIVHGSYDGWIHFGSCT